MSGPEMKTETGFADVSGGQIYYEVRGEGHPLVLTHEGIGDSSMFDDNFGVFSAHFRTIRYDMRGFGRSSVPASAFSRAQDLYELLRFLDVFRTYALGMSMGGAATIDFALSHPEMVGGLILAASGVAGFSDPDYESDPRWKDYEEAEAAGDRARLADLAVETWVVGAGRTADEVDAGVRERVRRMEAHNQSLGVDESLARELEPPAIGRLAEIIAPTLVLVGDHDLAFMRQISALLEQNIHGARRVVIPDTAHALNMEKPEVFNRLVLDFLASISG
jgi:pimeloyl-ACP methyl ester carboxylesterase